MSSIQKLIGGAFAFGGDAPFALHQLDANRAAKYLAAAVEAKLTWEDAEEDIRHYLKSQKCTDSFIDSQVARAMPMLKPWLS